MSEQCVDAVQPVYLTSSRTGYRAVYPDGSWKLILGEVVNAAAKRLKAPHDETALRLARAYKRLELERAGLLG